MTNYTDLFLTSKICVYFKISKQYPPYPEKEPLEDISYDITKVKNLLKPYRLNENHHSHIHSYVAVDTMYRIQ